MIPTNYAKSIINIAFGLFMFGCVSEDDNGSPKQYLIQGNWKLNQCEFGCRGGEIRDLKIIRDSIYSNRIFANDLVCDTCKCKLYNLNIYSKGKYAIQSDSMHLFMSFTDSNFNLIEDSCNYIGPESHKISIENDSLFVFVDSNSVFVRKYEFKKQGN
jgi:hypothetical protein